MDFKIIGKIARDALRVDRVSYTKSEILTVAHDNDRSYNYNGKYYSPLIDTIEDDLGRHGVRCQSVARIISTIKGDLSYGNVVSPEGGFARALVRKRASGLLKRGAYAYSKSEERVWASILAGIGARKVLAILPSRELCAACFNRGVWVADVQHGVIADGHPWYGEAFRAGEPPEWAPDAFLCWDQGSADVVNKWAKDGHHRSLIYGSRWVSRFLDKKTDDALVQELISKNQSQIDQLRQKPTILVSFSWGVYNIPNGIMVDQLADVIRDTSTKFNWQLRLHPNQIIGFASNESSQFVTFFNSRLKGHAEWEWATRSPLPIALSASDLHVSWNSSVAIEAAQMGIKSALLDPDLRSGSFRDDYYAYYHHAGMIDYVAEDRDTIMSWIEDNLGSKTIPEAFDEYNKNYDKLIDFLLNTTPTRAAADSNVIAPFTLR